MTLCPEDADGKPYYFCDKGGCGRPAAFVYGMERRAFQAPILGWNRVAWEKMKTIRYDITYKQSYRCEGHAIPEEK